MMSHTGSPKLDPLHAIRRQLNLIAAGLWLNVKGQDLIEYALITATIAVAVAAIFPSTIAPNISTIFSKIGSSLGAANN